MTYTGRVKPEGYTFVWLLHHPRVARPCVDADGNRLVAHFEVNAVVNIVNILERHWQSGTPVHCRVAHGRRDVMFSHRDGMGRDNVTELSPGRCRRNISAFDTLKWAGQCERKPA